MSNHTLPVKWDGAPIIWDSWAPMDGLIICRHGYRDKSYHCPQCKTKAHPRSITGKVLSQPTNILVLHRCMTCGYTTVMSLKAVKGATWQDWVLDDDDYTDAGSYTRKANNGSRHKAE